MPFNGAMNRPGIPQAAPAPTGTGPFSGPGLTATAGPQSGSQGIAPASPGIERQAVMPVQQAQNLASPGQQSWNSTGPATGAGSPSYSAPSFAGPSNAGFYGR